MTPLLAAGFYTRLYTTSLTRNNFDKYEGQCSVVSFSYIKGGMTLAYIRTLTATQSKDINDALRMEILVNW